MSVDHKPHPKPVQYVQIALVLGVLTAIEVALYYTEDIVGVFTDPLLIILADEETFFSFFINSKTLWLV